MVKRLVLCAVAASFCFTAQAATTHFKGYGFESYVVSDDWSRFPEVWKHGSPCLQVTEGTEYSLVINNPLPVRVAVAVTIDGLNVIDGKRTSADKAEKWMIDANSSLTLRGWQTDRSSLRRFIFTDQAASYAQWKGTRDKKEYTRNLGVIGVAYFWNNAELQAALHPPVPFVYRDDQRASSQEPLCSSAPNSPPRCDEPKKEKAGTGMGHRETNDVVDVEFHYDSGMYRAANVLAIYYEFATNPPRPQPFSDDNDRGNFTPEMPD
jgi:hypothetical protein